MENINNNKSKIGVIEIWGYEMPCDWLSPFETAYLNSLPANLPGIDWVCNELDRIWIENKLNNELALEHQPIGVYYSHPVWLMNGIFSVRDPASYEHRIAIAKYLNISGVKLVADYGGGFGQLAISIASEIQDAEIYIIEPFPTMVGIKRLLSQPRIKIVPNLSLDKYESVVAQDVLEHVEDPIKLAYEMANAVKIGGKLIFANCFYPVIQCHLPSNFHLRHTFPFVMKALGLNFVKSLDGAEHVQIYERVGKLSLSKARKAEKVSRLIGLFVNQLYDFLKSIRLKAT